MRIRSGPATVTGDEYDMRFSACKGGGATIATHMGCEKVSSAQLIRESGYSPVARCDVPGISRKNSVGRGFL